MLITGKTLNDIDQKKYFLGINLAQWLTRIVQAIVVTCYIAFSTGCQPFKQLSTCVPSDATAISQGVLPTVDDYLPNLPDALEPITTANASRLQLIDSIQMPKGLIQQVAYSPTGDQMAIVVELDSTTSRIYLLSDADKTASFHLPDVETRSSGDIAWSQDNTLLRSANRTLEQWNVTSRQLICQSDVFNSDMDDIEVSNNNKLLALTSGNGDVYLAQQESGRVFSILNYYNYPFLDADFSPDSKWLVTSTSDNKYQLWQADNGQQIWQHDFLYNNRSVGNPTAIEFSPTNAMIAIGNWPIGLADTTTGEIKRYLLDHVPLVSQLAFTVSGDILIANASGKVFLWSVNDGTLLKRLTISQDVGWIDLRGDNKVLVMVPKASQEIQFWGVTE